MMKGKTGDADLDLGLEDVPTGADRAADVGTEVAPDLDVDLDKYPPSIKYIMGNEACERFSFYGLKAILELYFKKSLMFSDNSATLVMHTFVFFAYFTSVPGGYVADAFLGKYRTILYFSLVYCFGCMFLSVTAIWESVWGAVIGLAIVAVGTGAIKACVSAFVGDQFLPGQESLLESVFGLLYFCINSGSLLSTIVTPLLREYVSPAVAFGVPAVLLLMATVVFWGGRKQYRVVPPQGSVLTVAARVVWDATRGWIRGLRQPSQRRLPYWDYAKATNDLQTVLDIKLTVRVLAVFTLLPLFWSLFDQNGSRWVLQADLMDRSFGAIELTADQIPTLNPLFTLSMIPVFNNIIYPGCRRIGISMKPLEHKMVFGMFLTGISFVLSGLLQVAIDRSPPNSVSVVAQIPQFFFLSCGEIMVSVTGLEFAYTQAPASMKSLVMSGWFMTTATGNLLVALIAALDWPKELVWNFFLFAALMFLFDVVFYFFTRNYQYRDGGCAEVEAKSRDSASPSGEQGFEMDELVAVDVSEKSHDEHVEGMEEEGKEEEEPKSSGDQESEEADQLVEPSDGEEMVIGESLDDLEDMSLLE